LNISGGSFFMLTFLSIIHILIGFGLVVFVLLQDPKGGAAGVFGGGSSSTSFFGASGASNFLTTATKWLAILFALSCLLLTMVTSRTPTSVLDGSALPPMPAPTAPAVPGAPVDGGVNGAAAVPAAPNQTAPGATAAPGAKEQPVKAAPESEKGTAAPAQ
jgi:preprotein translocase subunit SecG